MLLDAESFQNMVTANLVERFTQVTAFGGGSSIAITASAGPRSNAALVTTTGGGIAQSPSCRMVVPATDPTFVQGFRWKFSFGNFAQMGLSTTIGSSAYLIRVGYSGSVQCWVRPNLDGTISAYRGTTLLGTSARALSTGRWQFIEAEIVVNSSTGSVLVKVDGITFLNITGANTQGAGAAAWNEYSTPAALAVGFTNNWSIADHYVLDGDATDGRSAMLGPVEVNPLYVTAQGAKTDSTPSTGSNRAAMIDEGAFTGATGPDGDTTYNEMDTSGQEDSFAHDALPTVGAEILGVVMKAYARKLTSGPCTLAIGFRDSGVAYLGADLGVTTSYGFGVTPFAQNPVTAADFLEADLNSLEFEYKKTA